LSELESCGNFNSLHQIWPTKEIHSSFWVKLENLSKLGAFGYGPTASIKSEQMRKASVKVG